MTGENSTGNEPVDWEGDQLPGENSTGNEPVDWEGDQLTGENSTGNEPVDWEGDQLTGENSTGNEFEFDVFIVGNARQSCSSHHQIVIWISN